MNCTPRFVALPLAATLLLGAPGALGADSKVPGVWFLNARGTGDPSDSVRLTIGGSTESPPTKPEEVLAGWIWRETRPFPELLPDAQQRGTYSARTEPQHRARGGALAATERAFPSLGLVAGQKDLWLLAPEAEADVASAQAWANLLDAVEAAYRHSVPGDPLGVHEIGTLGSCPVSSRPVPETDRAWAPLDLDGHARPSVKGGSYLAPEGAATRSDVVKVRRFLRRVEGVGDCGLAAGTADLRLFPVPEEGRNDEFFLTVTGAALRQLSDAELDPVSASGPPGLRLVRKTPPEEPLPPSDPAPESPDSSQSPPWLAPLLLGLGMLGAGIGAWVWLRRMKPSHTPPPELAARLAVVETQLGHLRDQVAGELRQAAEERKQAQQREAELREQLAACQQVLAQVGAAVPGAPEPRQPPREEPSPPLPDEARAAVARLGEELRQLPEDVRQRLVRGLGAGGQLGLWIEQLWPALCRARGVATVEELAQGLALAASEELGRSCDALRGFAAGDACVLRWLARLAAGASDEAPSLAEWQLMQRAGWLEGEGTLPRRLRNSFEPYDRGGRLSEVILALQYLLEAYPVEQLDPERRRLLLAVLAEGLRAHGLPEDVHSLLAELATGFDLRYRPVRYYTSRTGQPELDFVRRELTTAISLSERVGFDAGTKSTVIVRLLRPFFFDLESGVYFAGHAHVARDAEGRS